MSFVRVSSVRSVTYALEKKVPPNYVVTAEGQVNSGGWSEAELSPWMYITPPADGVQDFDFVAKRPTGIVTMAFKDIEGMGRLLDVEEQDYFGKGQPLKGFRIHAAANSVVVMLHSGRAQLVK